MNNGQLQTDKEPLGVQDPRASDQASVVRSPRVPPGYKLTEVGVIPEDWGIEQPGRIGTWYSGGTPSMSNSTYWSGDVPWVSPKDMKVPRLHDSIDHISQKAVADGARVLPAGAVLMVIRGMILAHSFPVARAERPISFNQDLKGVVARDDIDSNFVLYWLLANAQRLRNLSTESTHGTKRLPSETLFREKVACPPPPEQRAIAAALSDVDAQLAKLDQLIAKKRDLKQAAMQHLLTGQTRLPGFGGEWEVKRVAELGDVVTGGTPRTDAKDFWGDGYPWVTPTDISSHRDMYTSERTLTQKGLNEIRALPANTVLVTCIASIGKNAILKVEGGCNQQINAVSPIKNNSAEFLYLLPLRGQQAISAGECWHYSHEHYLEGHLWRIGF